MLILRDRASLKVLQISIKSSTLLAANHKGVYQASFRRFNSQTIINHSECMLDFITGLHESGGFDSILTITDKFSKAVY